jgi:molybdopterin-guanine dinucleotide biosynthesis protein A
MFTAVNRDIWAISEKGCTNFDRVIFFPMNLESFILIGGRSSRMGKDKALLKIDGETFARRAVNTVIHAFPNNNISLVARDENQFAGADLPADIPVIFDILKDRGTYSGLHAALTSAQSEWIFVLACDYPFVTVELLKLLRHHINNDVDAVVPIQKDDRTQPLCAFYRTENLLPIVEKIIALGDLPPLRQIFDQIRARFVQFSEIKNLPDSARSFLNINSPEDLEKLRLSKKTASFLVSGPD